MQIVCAAGKCSWRPAVARMKCIRLPQRQGERGGDTKAVSVVLLLPVCGRLDVAQDVGLRSP